MEDFLKREVDIPYFSRNLSQNEYKILKKYCKIRGIDLLLTYPKLNVGTYIGSLSKRNKQINIDKIGDEFVMSEIFNVLKERKKVKRYKSLEGLLDELKF